MLPINGAVVYSTPNDYHPPPVDELSSDTEYPNLNTTEFNNAPIENDLVLHKYWDCVSVNEASHVVVATNKYDCREWTGSIWGFESWEDLDPNRASFKWQTSSIVSGLCHVSDNILAAAFHDGKVEIWSLSAANCDNNSYSPFLVGMKQEHAATILSMDFMKSNRNKILTGDQLGTLKVWSVETTDLVSIESLKWAHFDRINSLSSSYMDDNIFVSCSNDRTALLWDIRLAMPATAIVSKHGCDLYSIAYGPDQTDTWVFLGDRAGYVHTIDVRLPNKFTTSHKAFKQPVRKVIPKNDKLAALANSDLVRIYEATEEDFNNIYEHSETQHFIRDGAWLNDNHFLSVGYDGKLHSHQLPEKNAEAS